MVWMQPLGYDLFRGMGLCMMWFELIMGNIGT